MYRGSGSGYLDLTCELDHLGLLSVIDNKTQAPSYLGGHR